MKIGVDIRALMDREYSGVSLYTLDLLTEILRQDKQNEYILYYNSGRDIAARISEIGFQKSDNVKIIATHYPNKVFNYFLQKICRWPKLDVMARSLFKADDKAIPQIIPSIKRGGAAAATGCVKFGIASPPGAARNDNKVDVFWLPHLNFASFSRNCRLVLTIYDLSFLLYPEFFSWRRNFWHKFLGVEKLIRRADTVVTISENSKKDISRIFGLAGDKIKVIYPGIDREFRPLGKENPKLARVREKYGLPEKFILNLGTFEPRKNIPGLIRAFDAAAARSGAGEWHLVLAGGSGWKNKEIFQAIDKAKNKDRIKIIGYVKKSERAALYNLAEIFAYPSFYEGFGLPVLEAFASGAPVVTSAISSMPEVAGEAVLLIDPNDERTIAEALFALMNDEKLRESYSARGLEQAKKFSWEKSAEKYLELFKTKSSNI
jgi:glycosyltransferase involved in cell wall biosynthesis